MNSVQQLQATVDALAAKGKGILAADESSPTIAKRFDAIGVESTEEHRRAYRSLLFSTVGLGEFISGVILFEETLGQCDDRGVPLPELLIKQGIVPGIKVDKGKIPLEGGELGDEITVGLDGLAERLEIYKKQGARFAKWRDVYTISKRTPSQLAIDGNAWVLAHYAKICQQAGMVPIVEPEVLMDGDHTIEQCAKVTETVQHAVFQALVKQGVALEHTLLKPNMIVPGKDCAKQTTSEEIAYETVKILRRTVPAAVPSIHFLSGGLSDEASTRHLNAMNQIGPHPWELSFSYGRALQHPALIAWQGDADNAEQMQAALYKRAKLNGTARYGQYTPEME